MTDPTRIRLEGVVLAGDGGVLASGRGSAWAWVRLARPVPAQNRQRRLTCRS